MIEISCLKQSAAINDVKTQSSFDLTSYDNWRFNSTESQFTKMPKAYNVTHLMIDQNVSYWKIVQRIYEITVTLDCIFRLVLCSHEDVSFNIICLNMLSGIKQFYLSMWFKKNRLETPFKGDNVQALIKTSNCEKLVRYFSEKSQKIAAFAMLFWFSVTKQSLENVFGFPQ